MERHTGAGERRLPLAEFIERHRDQILAEWEASVRALPTAAQLDRRALRDHIPVLLDRIAESTRRDDAVGDVPDHHALERMDEGFDLDEVAREYALLRACILRIAETEARRIEAGGVLVLNKAIDDAIIRAVTRYHEALSRTLRSLDRISQEALGDPGSLDKFLLRMLHVLIENTEPVDAAAILLRHDDVLRVRAAVGLERELEESFSLKIGEGFAGSVAAQRRPIFLRSAATDPLVRSDVVRSAKVRAMYGVPLLQGDEVIGVVHIGSRTAWDFSEDDRQLLRTTSQRMAALIAQRQLYEERQLLVGVLAHDLRSPLSSILLSAEALLRRGRIAGGELRAVQRIVSGARRMHRLINELMDYSRVRLGGGLAVTPALCDLGEVAARVAEELRAAHPGRAIRVTTRGDTEGEWDAQRVAQLVANLGNNALSHGASDTPVSITVDGGAADEILLEVHNRGARIPPAKMMRLFEPQVQVRTGGAGLGLYIVRAVVRAHGGTVEAESSEREGTTFRARLPRWQTRPL